MSNRNRPCRIWNENPDGKYSSSRINDQSTYEYRGAITYASNENPYSSAAASETHSLYLGMLQEIGNELRPNIYQKTANLQIAK
jgi:hypothetical protein